MSKSSGPFKRPQAAELARRLAEPRRFIQVVAGARQVGKTTLVQQVTEAAKLRVRFASADEPTLRGADWIAQQWEAARLAAGPEGAILVLDEVQKALGWSESVKRLWDEDTRARRPLKVVLLGSAPLLVQQGLTESLAGRFEVLHLANAAAAGECELFYWRERNYEVDFVVRAGRAVTAIEVKSGRGRDTHPGLAAFADAFKPTRKLLVGGDGIPVEEVLREPVAHWVKG